jgi:hypothetical protein
MGVDFHGLAMVVGQPPIRSSTIEGRSASDEVAIQDSLARRAR